MRADAQRSLFVYSVALQPWLELSNHFVFSGDFTVGSDLWLHADSCLLVTFMIFKGLTVNV